jgi:hypothetical protein
LLEETGFSQVRLGKQLADEPAEETPSRRKRPLANARRTLHDLARVRELAKRITPTLLAAAGRTAGVRSRPAFDRYVARLAL